MFLPFVSLLKRIILGRKKSAIELIAESCEYGVPYAENKKNEILTGVGYSLPCNINRALFETTKVNMVDGVNVMLPKKICYDNGDCLEIKYFSKNERKRREEIVNKYANIKQSKFGYIIEGE